MNINFIVLYHARIIITWREAIDLAEDKEGRRDWIIRCAD